MTDKEPTQSENPSNPDEKIKAVPTDKIKVITYDGCEYLIYKNYANASSAYGFIAQKGKCSNPTHGHNKEKE